MSKSKQQEQDAKEVILILARQIAHDAELKYTQPKWRSVKDVVSDGLYLQAVHGKSESVSLYIKYIGRTYYISYDGKTFNLKLNRKNNKSLFFGPIPEASTKKKR